MHRHVMAALVCVTISAVMASVMYWSALFGSTVAINALLTMSMPKYNLFAAFIPSDLGETRWGMELLLGVVILQGTVILLALYALWATFRKR